MKRTIRYLKTKIIEFAKNIFKLTKEIYDCSYSPFIFIVLVVIYLLFFNKGNLTTTISIITLSFAIFQFWMNYINGVKKSLYNFRVNAIKVFLENDIQLSNYIYKAEYNIVMDFNLYLIEVRIFKDNIEFGLKEIELIFDKSLVNSSEYKGYKYSYESVMNACQALADAGRMYAMGDILEFRKVFGPIKTILFTEVNKMYQSRVSLYSSMKKQAMPHKFDNFL